MLSRTPLPELDKPSSAPAVLERPFYFIVVLWGERFRNYLVDLCLPTLLSPGNLPALKTRERSRFLIFTRPEDWAALQKTPVFGLLQQYVEPIYIEIPACPPGVSGCVHMGIGHRRGCEMAYAAKAYPLVLTPDCIFSDGMMVRLQELALQGNELVLVPALRFEEEALFEQLEQAGISPSCRNGMAAPITLKNRELVRMALASMHSETKTYEWDAPYFHVMPSAAWWRVPDEDGIVVHSLSWAPLLFDFSAVPEHDTSTFDEWTFDGDYIHRNLGNIKRVHLVLDSDEIFIASWGPSPDRPHKLSPIPKLARPLVGGYYKRQRFKAAFFNGIFDPFKQQIFFSAACWHTKPLTSKWADVEQRALRALRSCVEAPKERIVELTNPGNPNLLEDDRWAKVITATDWVIYHTTHFIMTYIASNIIECLRGPPAVARHLWVHREAIKPRIRQVREGNREVVHWLKWRMREIIYRLVGRVPKGKPARPGRPGMA